MKRCDRFPHKRRYSRHAAVRAALYLGQRGERHIKPFHCTCCSAWHVGHDWALIKLEERQR